MNQSYVYVNNMWLIYSVFISLFMAQILKDGLSTCWQSKKLSFKYSKVLVLPIPATSHFTPKNSTAEWASPLVCRSQYGHDSMRRPSSSHPIFGRAAMYRIEYVRYCLWSDTSFFPFKRKSQFFSPFTLPWPWPWRQLRRCCILFLPLPKYCLSTKTTKVSVWSKRNTTTSFEK